MANENETVEQLCAEMRSFGDVPPPRFAWRDLAERAEAAYKRELAAKDAEIARLKRENFDLNGCLVSEQELAEKRNALIKELDDALEWCNEQAESIGKATLTGDLQMDALTMTMASMSRRCIKLVAKAREVVK